MAQGMDQGRPIDSWRQYQDLCEALVPEPLDSTQQHFSSMSSYTVDDNQCVWVFRGQAKDWPLRSSIERLSESGLDTGSAEFDALNQFKRKAARHLDVLPKDEDTLAWLALMQHHGAPTRLLDWTFSGYVAAYFACRDCLKEDGVVYALNTTEIDNARARMIHAEREKNPSVWNGLEDKVDLGREPSFSRYIAAPFIRDRRNLIAERMHELGLLFRAVPSFESERLASQQGLFLTCSSRPANFLGALGMTRRRADGNPLKKWRIPAKMKQEIMRALYFANVHTMSLFPDLDGIGRMITESLTWRGVRTRRGATQPEPQT